MLELVVPKSEQYDDDSGCFITTKEQTLRLEHSLVSLSKWEAKWHKPYLVHQVEDGGGADRLRPLHDPDPEC